MSCDGILLLPSLSQRTRTARTTRSAGSRPRMMHCVRNAVGNHRKQTDKQAIDK
jgi:hypothetical protein